VVAGEYGRGMDAANKEASKRWSQDLGAMAASTYDAVCSTVGPTLSRAFGAVITALAKVTRHRDLATALAVSAHFEAQGAPCRRLIPAATMAVTLNADVAPRLALKDVCGTVIGWIAVNSQASGRAGARARGGLL
jgi:hypothetical protein